MTDVEREIIREMMKDEDQDFYAVLLFLVLHRLGVVLKTPPGDLARMIAATSEELTEHILNDHS